MICSQLPRLNTMILLFFLCVSSLYQLIQSVDLNRLRKNNHFSPNGGIVQSNACPQQYLHMVGDGWCDYGAGGINLNIEECGFDGGDCCVGSCGIATGSYDSSVSFYCGVVGYNCLDPNFANKTANSSRSIVDTNFVNATTVIVSETIFQGTALVVNVLAGKSHQLSNLFQYLSWNALDLSSSNVIITSGNGESGSGNPAKPPPKPPRPPVHPTPPPPHIHIAKVTTTTTTMGRRLSTDQQEVEIYNGERWVVTNVQVNAGTYRRRNAVAAVSWTMAYQQFQLINVNLSNEKSTQQDQQQVSLSNQQASETWLSSNVLERSLRFAAQLSHLSSFSNMKVCFSQVSNTNGTLSHTYSNDDIEICLQNYTAYASNRYIGDLSTLYESPACQQRMSDAWQARYGQEGYLKWMIAYVTLWLLVWLFAMKYWMYHASFGCMGLFDGLCKKTSHQLLPNDNHSNNIPHESSVEMRESAHGSVHSQPHPQHQLSGRRHHRRRILEHVLMFYSSSSSSSRSTNVDRDDPNSNTDQHAGARHHRMSMLSQLWYMLRIPGFFSRSMLSMILVIVASLRIAHYFWVLAPYLTVISDSSASEDDRMMVKSIIVCREFSFTVEEQDASSNMVWKDGYLMSLWLVAFHVCLCWSLVSAVARHVHVAVRRSMVVLSLPFLPQSPPVEQPSNISTVNKETNPLSSGLPHAPLSEGTLSASALSGTHPQPPNGLVLASVNALHPAGDSEHHGEEDNLSVSASHGTMVPALLHLQILHFMVICVVLTTLVLMITWMVVAVIVQKTNVSSMVSDLVLRGLTGSGVEMFLHWTQRVTGAILVLESVILLTVSHWLARLHHYLYQQRYVRNDEVSAAHENPVASSSNLSAWIAVYVSALCLFILGILTILVSHEYFQHTDKEEDFMEENAAFENRQETHVTVIFSVYSLALRIMELLTLAIVGMFLTFQDVENTSMFLNVHPELDSHGNHAYGSGLSTPHFYSEEAMLMHQASMESGQIFGTQHMNTIQQLNKLASNKGKETTQKGNEVGAPEMVANNGDDRSVDSNHTARSGSFGFGYGYEGIGPIWLSLNWVRHWQKQEEECIVASSSVTKVASLESNDNNKKHNTFTEENKNIEEAVHPNKWWNWYSSKPQQKNSDPIIVNSRPNANGGNTENCVFEEEDNSKQFMWTNPMSSMMFAYHPLSGSNTNTKNITDSHENGNHSHQSQQRTSASISFHFPQLSSSASTVVLTDVVGHTTGNSSHASTTFTSGDEQSVQTVDRPVSKADPVWPSSLFNRRYLPLTDKGSINHNNEKMYALSQKDDNKHHVGKSVNEKHSMCTDNQDSVLTDDFQSEQYTQEQTSNLYGGLETTISSHGNSPLAISPGH